MPKLQSRTDATNTPDEGSSSLIMSNEYGQLTLTDTSLAAWLADELRATHRHSPGIGWLEFDGKRWATVTSDQVIVTTQHVFTELYVKEATTADTDRRKALTALLNRPKLSAVTGLLKGLLHQSAADFDSIENAHLLNVQNGVVDLRTGELGGHDPSLLFTKIAGASYVQGARHPDWDKALEAFADDDSRRWVQLKAGQGITGLPPTDAILMILQGDGANGKSAFLMVQVPLGDYATPMAERLVHSLPSHHPTELTDLKGVRFAFLEELPAGPLNSRRIKAMLGTAKMKARKIGQDSMTWDATHSLIITTNPKPQVAERDHGTWRRLAMVVFPKTFVVEDRELKEGESRGDEGLLQRLQEGRQGQHEAMLAWLVEGALAVYSGTDEQHLPAPPARVKADTRKWREGEDKLAQFVAEKLVFDSGSAALRSDVYTSYRLWAEARGLRPETDQAFTEAFESHEDVTANGVVKAQRRLGSWHVSRFGNKGAAPDKGRAWFGVRFRDEDDEYEE